jgi:phage baseplate assembly protein W
MTDLRLFPAPDAIRSDRDGGYDLQTADRPGGRDLLTIDGAENLRQALTLRLLTPQGALTALGHPEYGSRLHELIGERNDAATRNRAKMAVLQAIAADPRVAAVLSVDTAASATDPSQLDIVATVQAVAGGPPVTVALTGVPL